MMDNALYPWLMEGDPALVWQVQKDLLGAAPDVCAATQSRISNEGWGARLLALRSADGTWGGGLYSPKWTSTFYTMRLLYWLGLEGTHPQAVQTCALLLDRGFTPSGGIQLWNVAYTDCCVTAMLLAMAVHFGHATDERTGAMARWLLEQQLGDGGWNCNSQRRVCHKSSFHTTLSVLEALVQYRQTVPNTGWVCTAVDAGHAYFLRHRVFHSEATGAVARQSFTYFSFPPRWYFDVLRALDHFRAARLTWDSRLEDALACVQRRRGKDGRWLNQNFHSGLEHFRLEEVGKPSRWNTLRALRVTAWAQASDPV